MTTVYDVPAAALIKEAAAELKKSGKVVPPEWAAFVKLGADAERAPDDGDWWYTRGASLLRKLYINGPIGLARLRKAYGGKRNVGSRPERRKGSSGAVIAALLKQLEGLGFVDKSSRGRRVTPKGVSFLDGVSRRIKVKIPELEKY